MVKLAAHSKKSTSLRPYLIWACGALFYMYQFVLRVSPSVLVNDLMGAFQVDASTIGSLSAVAMYSYSLLQVPSGVLADRFGIKRIILGSISLCILGVVLFASTNQLWVAQLGRFILGAGSSAAFLSAGKIAGMYFSSSKRASLFGFTMAAGTVGALNGGAPLCYLVAKIGWRESLFVLGGIGVLVLMMSSFVLKNHQEQSTSHTPSKTMLQTLREVVKSKEVWINSIVAIGLYTSVSVLADLWGPSFIMQRLNVSQRAATEAVSLIYVGLFLGSLIVPFVSDFFNKRKLITLFCISGISVLLCILLYSPYLSLSLISLILFLIGFLGGAEMLCFAGACEAVSADSAATVTGLVNGMVMLTVAFAEHQVGMLLDYFWTGTFLADSIRFYSVQEFQYALTILPIVAILSGLFALFLRDYSTEQPFGSNLPVESIRT